MTTLRDNLLTGETAIMEVEKESGKNLYKTTSTEISITLDKS
jgi:hypothetical protein